MSVSVTSKLNRDANSFDSEKGTTFFVTLGEQNYDFKNKEKVWTNYDAGLFATGGQIELYKKALVAGAIIEVSGDGLITRTDPEGKYPPKNEITNAKLGFFSSSDGGSSDGETKVPF